ncbi:MAG: hypothetical protein QOI38_2838, partial [Sphingomonadales bacterium]|nr:hypothetical protein [Sphingomonadales bacterium]
MPAGSASDELRKGTAVVTMLLIVCGRSKKRGQR